MEKTINFKVDSELYKEIKIARLRENIKNVFYWFNKKYLSSKKTKSLAQYIVSKKL